MQILGCKVHQSALFGGRPPPGPAGGAKVLPQTTSPLLGEGEEGKLGFGTGREERHGGGRDGKWRERREGA